PPPPRDAGFLHLRSDIERRRLAGMSLDEASDSAVGGGIYSAAHSAATYARLVELARDALAAGYSAVVDAAFLTRRQRAPFRALAKELGVPFHVLACSAPRDTLARRIEQRGAAAEDPSEATVEVLAAQCEAIEALDAATEGAIVCPADLDDDGRVAALGRARPGLG
ncbi:MAG: ATP-binding protein, partial [Gammaproteobacteria bacterium]